MQLSVHFILAIILLLSQRSLSIDDKYSDGFKVADIYTNAMRALENIDASKPTRVSVVGNGNGFQVGFGGHFSDLSGGAEMRMCMQDGNSPVIQCIFKPCQYFTQIIPAKGYVQIGKSTLKVSSFNGQYHYSGNVDFVRAV
jgi:hypothetical protein